VQPCRNKLFVPAFLVVKLVDVMRCVRILSLGLLLGGLLPVGTAQAQLLADTTFAWKGYGKTGSCRMQVYHSPQELERPHTVVLQEVASNSGPTIVADARYLVEQIGREFGLDPAGATWVFHWGAFSYAEAPVSSDKELFLKATFRRNDNHSLTTPNWRVVSREEVEAATDRQFR
jgi:hypothetical protein